MLAQLLAPTAVTVYVPDAVGTNARLFVTPLFQVKNPFPVADNVTGKPAHDAISGPAFTVGIGNTVNEVD